MPLHQCHEYNVNIANESFENTPKLKQIIIVFTKKLIADEILGMLPSIHFTILCLVTFYEPKSVLKYTKQ
jgi:hypothetical protein